MDPAAAPAEITLGEGKYRMSPLTDRDISELDNWLRVQTLRLARESCAGADDDTMDRVMRVAFTHVNELTWTGPSGRALMGTIDGVARLVWQTIKAQHPDMTHDKVRVCLLDPRTLSAAIDVFDMLNGVIPKKKGATPDPPKNGTAPESGSESTENSPSGTDGPQNKLQT